MRCENTRVMLLASLLLGAILVQGLVLRAYAISCYVDTEVECFKEDDPGYRICGELIINVQYNSYGNTWKECFNTAEGGEDKIPIKDHTCVQDVYWVCNGETHYQSQDWSVTDCMAVGDYCIIA